MYKSGEVNLLEQVLEQGHRLRNAMVESILNNDPFYNGWHSADEAKESRELNTATKHKIIPYLRGDDMSRLDEKEALDTFRAMSTADIVEVTERSYASFQHNCECDTCHNYYRLDFSAPPPKRAPRGNEYLKHADTLKVAVHSLRLNDDGERMVHKEDKAKYSSSLSTTYFIEYEVPSTLLRPTTKKAKVDTGLQSSGVVRLCSKKLHKEAIYFKQISVHDVANLEHIDLDAVDLKFQVSCRTLRQKGMNVIGCAKFNMASFRSSPNLTCNQELIVHLQDGAPITLGTIKINLQLGCGRLYYGKEFIDSVSNNKENNIVLPEPPSSDRNVPPSKDITVESIILKPTDPEVAPQKIKREALKKVEETVPARKNANATTPRPHTYELQKPILFAFVYISQAEYLEGKGNSYFTCHPFCQNDLVFSSVVNGGSNPVFNFYQKIPIIYEEEFVSKLRDNYMIFEFYEKSDYCDDLIGVCSIPLHQYYLAFRNPVIVKYLDRNKLPVIGTDWYEPITDPATATITGQVQILVALGSEVQVANLENERGFRDDIVTRAKRLTVVRRKTRDGVKAKPLTQSNVSLINISPKRTANKETSKVETLDKAVQFECIMEKASTQTELLIQTNENDAEVKPDEEETFQAHVVVESALHLPTRKKCKSKKVKGRHMREELAPTTYVSFEAHKDDLRLTRIIARSANPKWDYRSDVTLPVELLKNNQKRLIFKVWKKAYTAPLEHNLQQDAVIGFATLDLTVLSAGLPSVQGWFNIVDFSNKCNGQIKINITPLENISMHKDHKSNSLSNNTIPFRPPSPTNTQLIETSEEPGELLSRALKRKFIELDEITQRLRSRLSYVTNDESDASNDEIADEFEKDINTLCVEEDYDMLDFVHEAQTMNLRRVSDNLVKWQDVPAIDNQTLLIANLSKNKLVVNTTVQSVQPARVESSSTQTRTPGLSSNVQNFSYKPESSADSEPLESSDSAASLDRQLVEGKQRIDTLLQKLSLISGDAEPFVSRHVSGCSTTDAAKLSRKNTEDEIFEELGVDQFDASRLFDATLFRELEDGLNSSSERSSMVDFGRPAPVGNCSDDVTK